MRPDQKVQCPICKTEKLWEGNEFRPFCSAICQLRDLGKWATEEYRVAAEEVDQTTKAKKKDPDEEE